ncbi:ArsR/SmtB family transcription factor [Candidatus Harpocratesius sp.]
MPSKDISPPDSDNLTPFEVRICNILGNCGDIKDSVAHYRNLQKKSEMMRKNQDLQYIRSIFDVLSNFDRLLILEALSKSDMCSCEFEALLQKSQPAVSRDLKKLEQANLIQGWKKGNFIHYSLIKPTFDQFRLIINQWLGKFENWFGQQHKN